MARNECPSYHEWLAHHRQQGVEHFYIIDNNSTDVSCHAALERQNDVTLWHWMRRANKASSNQNAAYNHYMPQAARTQWLAIIDVDEFSFGINATLASFLRSLPTTVRQLCLPWVTFGRASANKNSDGSPRLLKWQPECVAKANVWRRANSGTIGK